MQKKPLPPNTKGDLEVLKIFMVLLLLTFTLVYGIQRIFQPKAPQAVAPAAAGAVQGPSTDSP